MLVYHWHSILFILQRPIFSTIFHLPPSIPYSLFLPLCSLYSNPCSRPSFPILKTPFSFLLSPFPRFLRFPGFAVPEILPFPRFSRHQVPLFPRFFRSLASPVPQPPSPHYQVSHLPGCTAHRFPCVPFLYVPFFHTLVPPPLPVRMFPVPPFTHSFVFSFHCCSDNRFPLPDPFPN